MKECKRYLPLFLCLLALLVAGSGCSIGESDYPEGGGATTWELCDHTWEANYSLDDGTLVNLKSFSIPAGRAKNRCYTIIMARCGRNTTPSTGAGPTACKTPSR